MRKATWLVLSALIILALLPVTALAEITVTYDVQYDYTRARAVLEYTNAFRTGSEAWYWNPDDETKTDLSGTLSPLAYDYGLERAAMERAAEIAIHMAHQRPDGTMCFTAHGNLDGENIAAGYGVYEDAESVVIGWREDNDPYAGQGHRRNMLLPGFTAMGVGCVHINGVTYWAQEFGYEPSGEKAQKLSGPKTTAVDPDVLRDVGTLRASVSALTLTAGETAETPRISIALGWELLTTVTVNDVTWKSSRAAVASVEDGVLTAKSAGTARLTAAVFGQTVSVTVTVKAAPVPEYVTIGASAFPDAAFRKYVAANFDRDEDGRLSSEEIAAVTAIDITGVKTVKDLTGVALFTELEALNASGNKLTWLDLSANKKLTDFKCEGNLLKVTSPGGKYDLSGIRGLDPAKMSGLKNATRKGTELTALKPVSAVYTYDCGGGFKAKFTLKMAAAAVSVTSAAPKKASLAYTGEALAPALTVKALVNGTEQTLKASQYKAVYKNNVNAGTATVTVTGTGFFKGTVRTTFKITKVSLSSAKLAYISKAYDGTAKTPEVTVKAKVKGVLVTLTGGTDYSVSYKNNVNAGTATVTVKGKGNFKGTLTKTFTITPVKLLKATLSSSALPYTGKPRKPVPTVKAKVNGAVVTLVKGTDYTVVYTDNVSAGTATVTVTGRGNFTGTLTKTFKITE